MWWPQDQSCLCRVDSLHPPGHFYPATHCVPTLLFVPLPAKIGKQHPDRVVETSTLSSVPPPDITYTLALPTSDNGTLSALQLEAITYACQQHEVLLPSGQRAGFLIGDGAGVGKGRTVAGIIMENYLRGRKKALW